MLAFYVALTDAAADTSDLERRWRRVEQIGAQLTTEELNRMEHLGVAPLHWAAILGRKSAVETWLARGVGFDLSARCAARRWSPNWPTVGELIHHRATPEAQWLFAKTEEARLSRIGPAEPGRARRVRM